ncbi:calpain-5-like [Fundulus heteroclitus]|uniref:calpain-5-like n=1 Tax=Fundulus heteroclitus TaxID=8078 RepID=UPI00165A7E86|nr:calpain-5-like [Fundulus heteroclitus]
MGISDRDFGEFWMDFQDFCCYFTDVVVCRLVQRTLLRPSSHWRETQIYGEWSPAPADPTAAPLSSGKHSSTALTLSKSNVRLEGTKRRGTKVKEGNQEGRERGEAAEEMNRSGQCGRCINHRDTFLHNPQFMFEVQSKEEEVLICLQQEDRRVPKKNGGENLPIGFEVLKVGRHPE